ncbi:MAG: ATP-binding cassette domain-containing protein [Clostridiaceae bacterium]
MGLDVNILRKLKEYDLHAKFSLEPGCTGILGASGSGKSMTLKSIAGIESPDEGYIALKDSVFFNQEKKINLSPQQRKAGYLFQSYALFPNMTVEENIGAGLAARAEGRKNKVREMVKRFHLEGLETSYPLQLSGGQQQRVALSRILAYEPELLLLDEPFSAMDTYLKEELQLELQEVLQEFRGISILVTHDRDEVYRLCKYLMIMDKGEIIVQGKTKDVFENPKKYQAAKLTGCRNISRAEKIDDWTLHALDWGIILSTAEKVTEKTAYVGIRAHDFVAADAKDDVENGMKIEDPKISELPFEYQVSFKGKDSDNRLSWKFGRHHWNGTMRNSLPEAIQLPKERLLLLEE